MTEPTAPTSPATDDEFDVVRNMNSLIGAAFRSANDKRARSQQRALGMSELGGCRRQAAYKVLNYPISNPTNERTDIFADSREAMIGTLIHDLVLPEIASMSLTAEIEVPVVLQFTGLPDIPGHADMVDEETLIDLKTVGHNAVNRVQTSGPSKKHIWQTHGYAQALRNNGHDITRIALVYVDRSNGRVVHIHQQEFDPTILEQIENWWLEVNSVQDPTVLPRDETGPGLSRICDWCPWLKACWGETAAAGETGVQSRALEVMPDDERTQEVERLLHTYWEAAQVERDAKDRKTFARETLLTTTPGVYGDMILGWMSQSSYTVIDTEAAAAALTAAALPVPRVERFRQPTIKVRPKPQN